MVFSSLTFLLLFLPLVILLTHISTNIRWQNGVLLLFSLLFYGWGEPVWIAAMLVIVGVNYGCALLFSREGCGVRARRVLLIVGVIVSLSALFYFKYWAFLYNSAAGLFGAAAIPSQRLPIGISFYTFQVLTYTVDVYRRKTPVQRNPAKLLLYVSCFPQLIAGPIVQYGDVAPMLDKRSVTIGDMGDGMRLFILGLGKKVILANLCGQMLRQLPLADGAAADMTVAGAWLAAVLYSLQIYFDFSAYSDMAIGIGRMIGFRYKLNFDYPYISGSVTEFWRRWHISLGAFFRDYVYIPMGGNRVSRARLLFNLLVVWGLTGLWHGASWNFVVWGLYYGVLLVLEKLVLARVLPRIPAVLRHLGTLVLVVIGWVMFYYVDLGDGWTHILAMFGMRTTAGALTAVPAASAGVWLVIKEYAFFLPLCILFCLPAVPWLRGKLLACGKRVQIGYTVASCVLLTALLALCVLFLVGGSYNPFIYFRF